jgi:hypothetical protein
VFLRAVPTEATTGTSIINQDTAKTVLFSAISFVTRLKLSPQVSGREAHAAQHALRDCHIGTKSDNTIVDAEPPKAAATLNARPPRLTKLCGRSNSAIAVKFRKKWLSQSLPDLIPVPSDPRKSSSQTIGS